MGQVLRKEPTRSRRLRHHARLFYLGRSAADDLRRSSNWPARKRKLRLLMLPIGMMLKPGFRVLIDKSEPLEGRTTLCSQNACSAEIEISPNTLEALKKGTTMSVVVRVPGGDVSGHELTFADSAEGPGHGVRRQADRPQGSGAAAPGVAAAVAEEGGRAAQVLEQQQQNNAAAPAANATPVAPAAPAAAAPAPAPAKSARRVSVPRRRSGVATRVSA